jgi:hypothetical protein
VDIVGSWLRNPERGEWVIVVDNVKGKVELEPILECLPACNHGHVLLTARDEDVAHMFARVSPIDIGRMTRYESFKLTRGVLDDEDFYNDESYLKLIEHCKGIPGSLQQCLSLIRQSGDSIESFLNQDEGPLDILPKTSAITISVSSLSTAAGCGASCRL